MSVELFDQNLINDEAFTMLRNRTVRLEIPLYAPNPVPSDRILYLRMDAEARDFSDTAGTGLKGLNHLVVDPGTGAAAGFPLDVVKTRDGRIGNALDLNNAPTGIKRSTALFSIPAVQNGIGTLSNMTISFWVKVKTIPPAVDTDELLIFERDTVIPAEFSIKIRNSGGSPIFRVTQHGGGGFTDADTGTIILGEWYFFVYSFGVAGGGGEIRFARLKDTVTTLEGSEPLLLPTSVVTDFILGGDSTLPGVPRSANAIVDDLQVWKSTLSSSVIDTIFQGYKTKGRSSGRSIQTETFTDDVTAHFTHIFGGGQQSFVTRRTAGRDVARQDNLLTILRYPGFDEKATVIVDNIRREVREVQDAGGQGHHMQVFVREAKG